MLVFIITEGRFPDNSVAFLVVSLAGGGLTGTIFLQEMGMTGLDFETPAFTLQKKIYAWPDDQV
eukprot:438294-Pyramimonas_sp.AAC.1